MKLLDALNGILPVLGEHPVTSLTARSPTLAVILPAIQSELEDTIRAGWWFNKFPLVLSPDASGFIAVGTDVLSFVPTSYDAAIRGIRLINGADGTYVWTHDVAGLAVYNVPFEELPESVAKYVFYKALVRAYATDIGIEGSIRLWQEHERNASIEVTREHLRMRQFTTRRSYRYQHMRRAMRG